MWPNNAQQTSDSIWKTYIYIIHYTLYICNSARRCCSSSITLWAVSLHSTWEHSGLSDPSETPETPEFLSTKNSFNKKTPRETPLSSPDPAPDSSDDASRWWLPTIPKGHLAAVLHLCSKTVSCYTLTSSWAHAPGYPPLGQLSQDDSHHGNINIEMRKRIHIYKMLVIGKLHMFTRIRFHNTRK